MGEIQLNAPRPHPYHKWFSFIRIKAIQKARGWLRDCSTYLRRRQYEISGGNTMAKSAKKSKLSGKKLEKKAPLVVARY